MWLTDGDKAKKVLDHFRPSTFHRLKLQFLKIHHVVRSLRLLNQLL